MLGNEINKIDAITDRWKETKRLDNEVIYARAVIDIECKKLKSNLLIFVKMIMNRINE